MPPSPSDTLQSAVHEDPPRGRFTLLDADGESRDVLT